MIEPPGIEPLEYHALNHELCTVKEYFQYFHQRGIGVEEIMWQEEIDVGKHIEPGMSLGYIIWTRAPAVSLKVPSACEGTIAWVNRRFVDVFLYSESVTLIRLEADS
jgi:hypothetical protein